MRMLQADQIWGGKMTSLGLDMSVLNVHCRYWIGSEWRDWTWKLELKSPYIQLVRQNKITEGGEDPGQSSGHVSLQEFEGRRNKEKRLRWASRKVGWKGSVASGKTWSHPTNRARHRLSWRLLINLFLKSGDLLLSRNWKAGGKGEERPFKDAVLSWLFLWAAGVWEDMNMPLSGNQGECLSTRSQPSLIKGCPCYLHFQISRFVCKEFCKHFWPIKSFSSQWPQRRGLHRSKTVRRHRCVLYSLLPWPTSVRVSLCEWS